MNRLSAQVILSYPDPQVLTAAVDGLTRLVEKMPVAVAGPTFIRESAVVEMYTLGEPSDLSLLHLLLFQELEHFTPLTTTLIAFQSEEENKPA